MFWRPPHREPPVFLSPQYVKLWAEKVLGQYEEGTFMSTMYGDPHRLPQSATESHFYGFTYKEWARLVHGWLTIDPQALTLSKMESAEELGLEVLTWWEARHASHEDIRAATLLLSEPSYIAEIAANAVWAAAKRQMNAAVSISGYNRRGSNNTSFYDYADTAASTAIKGFSRS